MAQKTKKLQVATRPKIDWFPAAPAAKDPRIQQIKDELVAEWEKSNGPGIQEGKLQPQFQEFLYGNPQKNISSLEEKAIELFRQRFPESQTTAKEAVVPKISPSRPEALRAGGPQTKLKVSALGVLAELESIEPILRKHQQEVAPKISQSLQSKIETILPKAVKGLDKNQIPTIAGEIATETARETLENVAKIQDLSQINQVLADSLTQSIIAHPQIAEVKTSEGKLYEQVFNQTQDIAQANQPDLEKAAVLGAISQIAELKKPDQQVNELIRSQAAQIIESQHPLATPAQTAAAQSNLKQYLATYVRNLEVEILPGLSKGEVPSFTALQQAQEAAHQKSTKIFIEQTTKYLTSQERRSFNLAEFPTQIANSFNLRPLSAQETESLGLGFAQPNPRAFAKGGFFQKDFSYALSLATSRKSQNVAHAALLAYRNDRLQKELQEAEKELAEFQKQIAQGKSLSYSLQKKYLKVKARFELLRSTQKFHLQNQKRFELTLARLRNLFGTQGLNSASDKAWEICNLHHKQGRRWVPKYGLKGNVNRWLPSFTFGALAFRLSSFHLDFSIPGVVNYLNFRPIFLASGQKLISYSPPPFTTGGKLNINSFRQLTGTIAGSVGGIRNIAGTANTIKNIFRTTTMLAKGTTGPIGLIMLAAPLIQKAKDLIRKAVLGAAALGLYLLFMLGLKALGLVAGIAFGAVTGLPLLLFGPPGWIAYAGWVGFWGFYGFNNPLQMLNIVSHPFAWTSNAWSFVKGGFGLGGAGSAIGGFFTGLASSIWGGITGAAGATFGFLSGAANFVVGGLSGLIGTPAAIGTLTAIPVFGGIGAVAVGGTIVGVVTATSFFSTETDLPTTPGENQFVSVEKLASAPQLSIAPQRTIQFPYEKLPQILKFDVRIKAKANLASVVCSEKTTLAKEDGTTEGISLSPAPPCPSDFAKDQEFTFSQTITIPQESKYQDSQVINTFSANGTSDSTSFNASATATVSIGNPPQCAPNAVPIEDPWKLTSDFGPGHPFGVDIADSTNRPIFSTFPCTTTVIHADWLSGSSPDSYGYAVILQSGRYQTISAHMDKITVLVGDRIPPYGEIGPLGSTGLSTGPHVHYEVHVDGIVANPHDYGIPDKPIDQY